MRFVHTADLHVGANRYLANYLRRQEEMFDSIFDVAYDRNVDTVVIAGDIFDDPDTTTQAEREMVKRKLLEYDAAGFHILVIPGNHDLVDATGYTAIHYLAMLYKHGKFQNSVVTEETTYTSIHGTVFCLLCHRKHKFKEDLQAAVEGFRGSSLQIPHDHFVMVAHETIRGSQTDIRDGRTDSGYYELEKGEDAPDESLPVTYWALGDIHKVQAVSTNAFYSGSPLQTKFSDTWPKGVLVVDTDDPGDPQFVPVPSNRLIKAKKGDPIPPNSYVKWEFESKDEIPTDVPQNVVKIAIAPRENSLSLSIDGSLRDKLLEGVKQQGASEEEMVIAAAEVASLLEASILTEASDG
jgi:exonuclease SbcD